MPPAGYSGTPLWKKLGYSSGARAFTIGAPSGYRALLCLPAEVDVSWIRRAGQGMGFVHLFAVKRAAMAAELRRLRRAIAPSGVVWVSWPKKASRVPTDITEDTIREEALPMGFVDVKVCAVDETWSGLKLMTRRTER
jgi:hypothetical protein